VIDRVPMMPLDDNSQPSPHVVTMVGAMDLADVMKQPTIDLVRHEPAQVRWPHMVMIMIRIIIIITTIIMIKNIIIIIIIIITPRGDNGRGHGPGGRDEAAVD
jgi:hypothetical protein